MEIESIPDKFIHNLKEHFDSDVCEHVLNALTDSPSVSIRLNDQKAHRQEQNLQRIPWTKNGYMLPKRPSFSQDPLLHAGTYYVQDASSMVLEFVLEQLEFDEGILALDVCAAPGGKSIILSDYLRSKGFLIANEIDSKRNAILTENLCKWGASNTAVSQLTAEKLAETNVLFDLVVIDAPCSGEGMFRKDAFAKTQWNDALIQQCVESQQSILNALKDSVAIDGYLIYSTCTLNRKENEEQIAFLLNEGYELALPDLGQFSDYIVPAISDGSIVGHYLLPGISLGEGLFISVLKRTEKSSGRIRRPFQPTPFKSPASGLIPNDLFEFQWRKGDEVFGYDDPHQMLRNVSDRFPFKAIGLPAYIVKGKSTIPLHGVAMHSSSKPTIHLSQKEALDYLRKDRISAEPNSGIGWALVGYENAPLGWAKILPNRVNNYYPQYYRLRD